MTVLPRSVAGGLPAGAAAPLDVTPAMRPEDWVAVIEGEYLDAFLPGGGACVKFAVPRDPASREDILQLLPAAARRRGLVTTTISSADTRIHMIDEVFFRIAEQVPWQRLSRLMLGRLAAAEGYRPPADSQATAPSIPFLEAVAAENDQDPEVLRGELRRRLTQSVFRNVLLAREFRVAMSHLCAAELIGGVQGATTRGVITEWLTGRNRRVGAVKPYEIYSRIHRGNARHLLESLLRWIHQLGLPGTLVVLDTERLTVARNPRDGGRYYTRPSMMDAYEVLRQLIDSTDRLEAAMFAVIPAAEFLDTEAGSRGMGDYEALKFRVYDEVRDRRLVNPMASLVRLAAAPAGVRG